MPSNIPQRRSTLNPLAPGRCDIGSSHQGQGENLCCKLEVAGSVHCSVTLYWF